MKDEGSVYPNTGNSSPFYHETVLALVLLPTHGFSDTGLLF